MHEKAEALLKKLHVQYRRSGTEAVLIAHKLNSTEYLRVIGKPAHLIISLYEHPSICQRIQNLPGTDYPGEDSRCPFIRGERCACRSCLTTANGALLSKCLSLVPQISTQLPRKSPK